MCCSYVLCTQELHSFIHSINRSINQAMEHVTKLHCQNTATM